MPTSFFRSLVVVVLASLSIVAFAGGPGPATPPKSVDKSGVYVDLSAGYAWSNWSQFGLGVFDGYSIIAGSGTRGLVSSNGRGGATFGFDVGYRINTYLGIEGGWYYLPQVKGNSDVAVSLPNVKLNSWIAYLALKVFLRVSQRLELIGKTGLGYRRLHYRGNATSFSAFGDDNDGYFSAILGIGLQYWLNQSWSITLQDLHMLKHTSGGRPNGRAPSANMLVLSVGHLFGVI